MNWSFRTSGLRSRSQRVAPGATGGTVGQPSQPAQPAAESVQRNVQPSEVGPVTVSTLDGGRFSLSPASPAGRWRHSIPRLHRGLLSPTCFAGSTPEFPACSKEQNPHTEKIWVMTRSGSAEPCFFLLVEMFLLICHKKVKTLTFMQFCKIKHSQSLA